jgi:hypothetical protein
MARVTTIVLLTLSLCNALSSTRINVEEPHQNQIDKVTEFIVNQINSSWMYGGSYLRLFSFCKRTDSVLERLMRDLAYIKPLAIVIGDQNFLYPLETLVRKSTFNVILVENSDLLMVSGHFILEHSNIVYRQNGRNSFKNGRIRAI